MSLIHPTKIAHLEERLVYAALKNVRKKHMIPKRNTYWKTTLWLSLWLFFLILFVILGFWQLQRYHWKKELLATYQQRIIATPLSITALDKLPAELLYYRVQVTGEAKPTQTLYWQNRYYHDHYGYHVLTPLWIAETKKYLIVDRGFIEQLPNSKDSDLWQGEKTISGIVYYPDKTGFILGKPLSKNIQGQSLVQKLDFSLLSKTLQAPVYPFIVYIQSPIEQDKRYSWPLSVQKFDVSRRQDTPFFANIIPPSRHLGYAVQWFAMALVLAIAIIVSWFKRT
jgi:surfeit locus 1 family protein